MSSSTRTPPGWPASVPPADSPGWQGPAVAWLLDHCPSDYRGYPGWRKNPVALAWVAVRHIDAQLEAMRQAYREVRIDLADLVSTEALTQIQSDLEAEGLRLRASARGALLLYEAMQGKRYVPRL
ncbi:MAG: hypothetical protein ABI662_08905 [Dermatophilaceae bacterium]